MFATRKRPPTTTVVYVSVRLRWSSLNRMTAIIVAALLNSEASISDLHCAQGEARVTNSRGSISSRSLGHGARCVLITSIAVKNVDVTLLVCLSEWRNGNLRAKPTHTLVTLTANWI